MVSTENIIITPGSFAGRGRINQFMRNLPKNLNKYSEDIIKEIAKDLQRGMRFRVPKDTKALWRSINVTSKKRKQIIITIDSPYAQALEFGFTTHQVPIEYLDQHRAGMGQGRRVDNPRGWMWSKWKGQQFVRPSIKSTEKRLPKIAERAINKAILRS